MIRPWMRFLFMLGDALGGVSVMSSTVYVSVYVSLC